LLVNARARLGAKAGKAVERALVKQDLCLDQVIRVGRPSRLRGAVDEIIGQGVKIRKKSKIKCER